LKDQERQVIKYRFDYSEEQGYMGLEILHTLTKQDVVEVLSRIKNVINGSSGSLILVDMSQVTSDPITKQARSTLKQCGQYKCGKVAVVGGDAVNLMIAKIALTIAGQEAVTRYFKEKKFALAWLMDENND
jgi:hypothetical protein